MTSFTRDADAVTVPCRGVNHHDFGTSGRCDNCGTEVARRDDGAMFPIVRVGTYQARKLSCWAGPHRCDPAAVDAWAASQARTRAAGGFVKGDRVEVVKGRKLPLGTTGIVRWLGENDYGTATVGLAIDDAPRLVYVAQSNVKGHTE